MIARCSNRCRGSLMFGMAALIFVLGMLCGTALLRSLDAYAASAQGERRIQARNAAEGAVVVLSQNPEAAQPELQIGCSKVTFSPARREGQTLAVPFTVDVMRSAPKPVLTAGYTANYTLDAQQRWQFQALEQRP